MKTQVSEVVTAFRELITDILKLHWQLPISSLLENCIATFVADLENAKGEKNAKDVFLLNGSELLPIRLFARWEVVCGVALYPVATRTGGGWVLVNECEGLFEGNEDSERIAYYGNVRRLLVKETVLHAKTWKDVNPYQLQAKTWKDVDPYQQHREFLQALQAQRPHLG